jgi:hypothetical protein
MRTEACVPARLRSIARHCMNAHQKCRLLVFGLLLSLLHFTLVMLCEWGPVLLQPEEEGHFQSSNFFGPYPHEEQLEWAACVLRLPLMWQQPYGWYTGSTGILASIGNSCLWGVSFAAALGFLMDWLQFHHAKKRT